MKTTETNNKMIAEFMGFEDASRIIGGGNVMRKKTEWKYGCQQYKEFKYEDLKYHSSWDWLMSVVEKIENFEDENRCAKYNFNCVQSFVEIVDNETSEEIIEIDLDNKFDSIYQAVVQFIEWYNKQALNKF